MIELYFVVCRINHFELKSDVFTFACSHTGVRDGLHSSHPLEYSERNVRCQIVQFILLYFLFEFVNYLTKIFLFPVACQQRQDGLCHVEESARRTCTSSSSDGKKNSCSGILYAVDINLYNSK